MQTIQWTNSAGQDIIVTVSLISNTVDFDVAVGGTNLGIITGGLKTVTGHAVIVAGLGKLGLNAERAAQVATAIEAVEAERVAHIPTAHEIEMREFDRQGYDLARKMSQQG